MADPVIQYPRWRYHISKPAVCVKDAAEEKALGPGYFDNPAGPNGPVQTTAQEQDAAKAKAAADAKAKADADAQAKAHTSPSPTTAKAPYKP